MEKACSQLWFALDTSQLCWVLRKCVEGTASVLGSSSETPDCNYTPQQDRWAWQQELLFAFSLWLNKLDETDAIVTSICLTMIWPLSTLGLMGEQQYGCDGSVRITFTGAWWYCQAISNISSWEVLITSSKANSVLWKNLKFFGFNSSKNGCKFEISKSVRKKYRPLSKQILIFVYYFNLWLLWAF